jgi:hypothetical protein
MISSRARRVGEPAMSDAKDDAGYIDPEVEALAVTLRAIRPLDVRARMRVMHYVASWCSDDQRGKRGEVRIEDVDDDLEL